MAARVLKFFERHQESFDLTEDSIEAVRYFGAIVSELPGAVRALRQARPDLQMWQPHPELPCWVRRWVPQLVEGQLLYHIDVHYSSEIPDQTNPLERPADITWTTQSETEEVFRFEDGEPIQTTAGELISGVTRERKLKAIHVEKNVPSVPSWFLDYDDAINSDAVRIQGQSFAKDTLKLSSPTISNPQTENDIEFRRVAFDLVYKPETWERVFPNAGYYELETGLAARPMRSTAGRTTTFVEAKKLVQITDDQGEPIKTPEWLDDNGRRPRVTINGVENIKRPLERSDFRFIKGFTSKRLPFSRLPLR